MNRVESGKRLQELRTQRGMSRAALGQAIGVSETAVQYYEAGERTPRDDIKVKIASLFGVSILDLFYADEPTNS